MSDSGHMRRLIALAVVVTALIVTAGGVWGSAAGKVVSAPYPKAVAAPREAPAPTTTTAPEAPPVAVTAPPAPQRDLIAECWATVERLLPVHPQPATWAAPVCQPPIRPQWSNRVPQGYVVWADRTIHLQPHDERLDLEYLYLHEVGHAWCEHTHYDVSRHDAAYNYDWAFSEECADEWAATRS